MIKIDQKDLRILYELDLNCRQSFSKIGKKTGLTKSSVAYRIQRLEQEGIIKNYYTFIDGIGLGYIVLRLYIIFQYTTKETEEEIINFFKSNKNAVGIFSLNGRYDLEIIFWIKDINKFYQFWQQILNKYGDYFQEQVLSFYIRYITYKFTYLISNQTTWSHRQYTDIMGGEPLKKIDEIDYKILTILAPQARIPLTEIAQQLNMSSDTINYRINKLQKANIIRGFRVNIDFEKLGYHYFKADIYLKDYQQRRKIIQFITTNPHLISINETTGSSHLELELHLPSLSDLHNLMNDINKTFPNAMRNYKYFIFQKIHQYVFLPEDTQMRNSR
jgi:DNA-binding Lrp family transcriptional regulator